MKYLVISDHLHLTMSPYHMLRSLGVPIENIALTCGVVYCQFFRENMPEYHRVMENSPLFLAGTAILADSFNRGHGSTGAGMADNIYFPSEAERADFYRRHHDRVAMFDVVLCTFPVFLMALFLPFPHLTIHVRIGHRINHQTQHNLEMIAPFVVAQGQQISSDRVIVSADGAFDVEYMRFHFGIDTHDWYSYDINRDLADEIAQGLKPKPEYAPTHNAIVINPRTSHRPDFAAYLFGSGGSGHLPKAFELWRHPTTGQTFQEYVGQPVPEFLDKSQVPGPTEEGLKYRITLVLPYSSHTGVVDELFCLGVPMITPSAAFYAQIDAEVNGAAVFDIIAAANRPQVNTPENSQKFNYVKNLETYGMCEVPHRDNYGRDKWGDKTPNVPLYEATPTQREQWWSLLDTYTKMGGLIVEFGSWEEFVNLIAEFWLHPDLLTKKHEEALHVCQEQTERQAPHIADAYLRYQNSELRLQKMDAVAGLPWGQMDANAAYDQSMDIVAPMVNQVMNGNWEGVECYRTP